MTIYLSQDYVQSIFIYNPNGYLIWNIKKKGHSLLNRRAGWNNKGYRLITVDQKTYFEHHIVWLYFNGELPKFMIDHINRIKDDNRIENLRLCLNGQKDNSQNTKIRKDNTSSCKGVTWCKRHNKWKVRIVSFGETISLGYYKNFNEAVLVRKEAEMKYHTFAN